MGRGQRIRVGYLSFDWRDHPMGRLTMALVTAHNRSRLECICFYYGPQDRVNASFRYSGQQQKGGGADTVYRTQQQFFEVNCERFVHLSSSSGEPMTDTEAAALIRSFELHVLVDLTAHTTGGRMGLSAAGDDATSSRITINYLGYPGTTGERDELRTMRV